MVSFTTVAPLRYAGPYNLLGANIDRSTDIRLRFVAWNDSWRWEREAKRLPYNRKPPPTSVGEYNDNERTEVRRVRLVRVVSFLYRLFSFRVILSLGEGS